MGSEETSFLRSVLVTLHRIRSWISVASFQLPEICFTSNWPVNSVVSQVNLDIVFFSLFKQKDIAKEGTLEDNFQFKDFRKSVYRICSVLKDFCASSPMQHFENVPDLSKTCLHLFFRLPALWAVVLLCRSRLPPYNSPNLYTYHSVGFQMAYILGSGSN